MNSSEFRMETDSEYNLPKASTAPWKQSFGKHQAVFMTVIFLQSLLIAWFLLVLSGTCDETLPLFRFLQGIAVLFAILLPVFVLLEGFQNCSITDGFIIPMALYTLMFPLFNSLLYRLNLFLDPAIILPAVISGIGFGLIGLGAYHLRKGVSRTFALVTAGVTMIFLSSPVILRIFFFVLTGNLTSLHMAIV